MSELWGAMRYWISEYYGDGIYLVLAAGAYLYLFVHCKETRKRMIYPMAFILFCLLNPILYRYVWERGRYWRFFWIFPNTPAIAYVATELIRRNEKKWEKIIVFVALAALIVLKGTNVFINGSFVPVQNRYKISQEAVEISKIVLKKKKKPLCVVPTELYSEVRQYSGKIKLLYGRDAEGYIIPADEDKRSIYAELNNPEPDYNYVLAKLLEYECNYLVVPSDKGIPQYYLELYQCELCGEYGQFVVYAIR